MKKQILQISLAASLLLSLSVKAQETTAGSNLHKTVTHGSDRAAINNGSETKSRNKLNAQENTMPQHWKNNMDAAKFVESTLKTLHDIASTVPHVDIGLPDDFNYDIKSWTQKELTTFAKCDKTFDFFENILGIGNAAVKKDKSGNFTPNAIEAQQALMYLKPDCCKSWKGFCNMIANASDETENLRAQYHKDIDARKKGGKKQGAIIDITNLSSDIAFTDSKVETMDPKTIFAAAGGVISPEQVKFDEAANAALAKLKAEKNMARAA